MLKQVRSEYDTPMTVTSGRYTIVLHVADGCGFVTAYRTTTGKRLWKKKFYGGPARMVSDGKVVYVVNHSFATGDVPLSPPTRSAAVTGAGARAASTPHST